MVKLISITNKPELVVTSGQRIRHPGSCRFSSGVKALDHRVLKQDLTLNLVRIKIKL